MFLSGEKIKGERCMSAEGSSVKGGRQQSFTSFPKVKGVGPLFSGPGPLITGGLVNDTTPAFLAVTPVVQCDVAMENNNKRRCQ